jgi:hypothetical protein
MLRDASRGRSANAPLLTRGDGAAWDASNAEQRRQLFQEAVKRAGVDPGTTFYAFRHSSIVRQLLANVPVRVVASLHDTSVLQIEKHYAAFISDFADSVSRAALLDLSPANSGNVVPLQAGRGEH